MHMTYTTPEQRVTLSVLDRVSSISCEVEVVSPMLESTK